MADWYVRILDATSRAYIADYSLMEPTADIRNSEPGGFTGQIALGQTKRNNPLVGIGRDEFAPYSAHYELWRQSSGNGSVISAGMLTSLNFNFNRDTALIGGKDWLHYLQRRIYPFNPTLYLSGEWVNWPRTWPDTSGKYGPIEANNPVDVGKIVRQLIQSMRFDPPSGPVPITGRTVTWPNNATETVGVIPITQNIKDTGLTTKYQIYPGDSTTIFDHITKLSEQTSKGFEFNISPLSLRFHMWTPRKWTTTTPIYTFSPGLLETTGAIVDFDWTNEGPEGTYLVGLGSGEHKTGAVWTDADNVARYKRLDKVYDFGELQNTDLILQMLKDQNDLHPQKKLSLALLNPEFLPINFYTGGRPIELIGASIRVTHDFAPLHKVDAYFRINAINWDVDKSTNETVILELEMIHEPTFPESPYGV